MKKALITGITGQDGSYLAEFLLEKGYDVHGVIRRSSVDYRERIAHLEGHPHFHLHYGDLSDSMSILSVVSTVRPDEIYNLAAQSHVQVSFDVPEFTADVDATGVLRVLEAVRLSGLKDTCRIYQASTSELYGKVEEVPQNENTPFHPYSPYAVAKQYGFWIVKEYREAYNMFCCSGILFNHESERRGENFVTRKITLAAGRIAEGIQDHLELGNMDSLRDWGYAKDYVECMWMIMQHETPEDFVIATGEQHTVRDFTEKAFAANGITIRWEGTGLEEKGYEIVERNFKCRFGEIDVIAQNDRYLAFVEVKTRSADGLSHPFEAITPSKRAKVIKTAQYYLINHETNLQPRFDAAAVFTENGALVKIEYLENAFY